MFKICILIRLDKLLQVNEDILGGTKARDQVQVNKSQGELWLFNMKTLLTYFTYLDSIHSNLPNHGELIEPLTFICNQRKVVYPAQGTCI